jgi:hypothetical protein
MSALDRATYFLLCSTFRLIRPHDHALDAMDQFERAILAVLNCLRWPAPAAIQKSIGCGHARRMSRIFGPHYTSQGKNGGSAMTTSQRSNVGKGLGHSLPCVIG